MGSDILFTPCPLCASTHFKELINYGSQPLCASLLTRPDISESYHEGRYVYCPECMLARIASTVALDVQYEEYEYFSSGLFPPYVKNLAEEVAGRDQKKNGLLVEIGSNDGGFLSLLREHGCRNLLGIEPSKVLSSYAAKRELSIINEYLTPHLAAQIVSKHGPAKLMICRFVLEHVVDLKSFMGSIRDLSDNDTRTLIEVPCLEFLLERGIFTGFWDQHTIYWTLYSLQAACLKSDLEIESYSFDDSRAELTILAWIRRRKNSAPLVFDKPSEDLFISFSSKVEKTISTIREIVNDYARRGKKIACYGSSHNPTNVLNYCGIGHLVEFSVDDDTRKHGKFMPGSKLPIFAPDEIYKRKPELCIIGSVGNEKKIAAKHQRFMTEGGQFLGVYPAGIISSI